MRISKLVTSLLLASLASAMSGRVAGQTAAPTPSTTAAAAAPPQAALVLVQGPVHLRTEGARRWARAERGTSLRTGDHVRTGRTGRARLRYWDGVEVTLEPDAEVEVLDRAVPEDEALRLLLGEVLVEIRRSAAAEGATTAPPPFRIRTPRAVAGAEGTRFRVRVEAKGEHVAVLEGTVQVETLDGEERVRVGPAEEAILARDGALRGKRPLALPWAAASAGVQRRERRQEPFFGELGRFRDSRFLGLVDPRRDALHNPARVAWLLEGQGFALGEVSVSPRQGRTEAYQSRDLSGTPQVGVRDPSEAGDGADLFTYRALDDGRWAGALQVRRTHLRTRELLHPAAPSPFAGGTVRRHASLEGPRVAGQVQRAWRSGRSLFGVGLLHEAGRLDGREDYAAPAGGPVQSETHGSEVDEERTILSLGYSWDQAPDRDLGLVFRFQERSVVRGDEVATRNGAPVAGTRDVLLDRDGWGLDSLWRRRLPGRRVLALRGFVEGFREHRRARAGVDPSLARPENPFDEDGYLYGLAAGMTWRPRTDLLLAADLSWQRLDSEGTLRAPSNGLLLSDLRDTRTSLHLGGVRSFPGWDLRLSLELARVHRTEGLFAGPGFAGSPPPGDVERSWESQVQVTVGRWLAREQRIEVEFEEREPETPERVWRVRWVRRF